MERRSMWRLAALTWMGGVFAALVVACGPQTAQPIGAPATASPNIILILADDLGYADVGYNGGQAKTPRIDALAAEGLILENFYVMLNCTPTRAGLLTGNWPNRYGLMNRVVWPWSVDGLPPEALTLPEALGQAGYAARGMIGKWHLGHASAKYHPLSQGFTEFVGAYNGEIDYYTRRSAAERDWHDGFAPLAGDGYVTDEIGARAAAFVTRHAGQAAPYFLYVPFTAPHRPNQAPQAQVARNAHIPDETDRIHAAMVSSMDDAIGAILDAVSASGEAADTLIVFVSDNGGDRNFGGNNAPWRGGKGTPYEGGIRAPAILSWPTGLPRQSRYAGRIGYIDLMPTLLSWAGAAQENATFDGIDLAQALRAGTPAPDRDWFTLTGSDENEILAVTRGTWKLVRRGPTIASGAPARSIELYDLAADPQERVNRAAERPDLVQDLLESARAFRALDRTNAMQAPFAGASETTLAWWADRQARAREGREGGERGEFDDNNNAPIPGFTAPPDWRIQEEE